MMGKRHKNLPGHISAGQLLLGLAAVAGAMTATIQVSHAEEDRFVFRCDDIEKTSSQSSLGTKLYQGTEGWFFRKSELENLFEIPADSQKAFSRINDALAYKGIHLVLLPMLPRGIAGHQYIPNDGLLSDMLYEAAFSASQFSSFIASLEKLGVDVIDINDLKTRDSSYDWDGYTFSQDIHWKPEGARLVAELVAERMGTLLPENTNPVEFETTKSAAPVPIDGGFTQALNEICQEKIPVEEFHTFQTKQVLNSLDSLFGDDGDAPADELAVHIVGTSFTDEKKKYNFAGFLREFLQRDVANFAVAGGGLTESIYGWAQNENGIGLKPKILLWEYSNHRDVLEKAAFLNNAVVPAIFGACTGELLVAEDRFNTRTQVSLSFPPQEGTADEFYVRFDFSNPALAEFQIQYAFPNGRIVRSNFTNPERVTGLTELYQALPGDETDFPETLAIKFGNGLSTDGSVQLCRFPPNVFSSQTVSN